MRIDRVKFAAELVRRDMTKTRLAELSGVSRITITSIAGGKSCAQETADKLSMILGPEILANEV